MLVEFIGGPKDGDTAELPDTMRYYRVPLHSMPAVLPWEDETAQCLAALDALRCGVYQPHGKPTEFIWHGEERG